MPDIAAQNADRAVGRGAHAMSDDFAYFGHFYRPEKDPSHELPMSFW
jgi:hypothetical protein